MKKYRNKETGKIWELQRVLGCNCECVILYRRGVKSILITRKDFNKKFKRIKND